MALIRNQSKLTGINRAQNERPGRFLGSLVLSFAAALVIFISPISALAIAGGKPVQTGQIPFIASVRSSVLGFHCGASVIAPTWILTAAHCVSKPWSKFGAAVAIGEDRSEVIAVKSILIHPFYGVHASYSYDFALLELARPTSAPAVLLLSSAISVPSHDEVHAPHAIIAGWGAITDSIFSHSKVLLAAVVPLVSQSRCAEVYGVRIDRSMICAGFEAGGHDSCSGDSGGPLFLKNAHARPILVGLVSDGDGCARPHKPGFYARIEVGLPWIKSVLHRPPSSLSPASPFPMDSANMRTGPFANVSF